MLSARIPSLLAACVALGIGALAPVSAAGVDIDDTHWNLGTKLKLAARPLGQLKDERVLDLDLFSFDFEMPDIGLTGIHESKGNAFVLTLDELELEEFLVAELEALAEQSDHAVTVGAVTVLKQKGVIAAKPRGTEIALALRVSVTAAAELVIDGKPLTSKVALSLAGSDSQDYELVGTDWEAEVKSSATVAGVGKFAELGDFEMSFDESEVDVYESLGGVLLGDWYVDSQGDLQVLFDEDDLLDYVGEIVDEVASEHFALLDVDELVIDSSKLQFKVKAGVSIKFSVSFKYRVIGQLEGEPVEAQGSFSSKGVALLD